ncbi:uncharacterized protein LOC126260609 [Schistocerca nitens]|uniref:uncharacterized protein LOC126260608 n=1 Tax=Schistocerca nitens TaxID=7011 RepID=UPI0021173A4E|nr:uncharacterized protein LOC126260608 [Schistocerca nitens]XP_049813902.1 uncharacterized protein LOC126260609 [Schistocerca nitens]
MDFLKWKSKEEKLARCSFVMHGGAKHVKGATKITYVCHRSGIFISRSKGKRLLKSQGSNKMGGHCTSAIEVSQEKTGKCTCVYFKTHFGHELNIGFLHLSKSEREIIAGKIAEGVTFQRILDDVRDSIHCEEVKRLHLLTRKDLHNIKREKAGVIKSTVFMSDDTNVFRCAWAGVMGLAEHNLLCTWHIDRSWRSNLRKVHGGPNKQTQVYKALRMLLEEADIEKFSELLELFERELQEDEDTREFGMYFTNHYGFRPQHWAYCYRCNLNINTNMHLEAMHRVLKYCYLDGKTNNRLDKLLLVLMKLVRDKSFERIIKLYKGGHTHRIEKIQERHRESKKIDRGQITANSDGKRFYVKSQSTSGITYTVTLKALECNLSCRLLCCTCNICIHSFSCCCPDNLINLNICKHIHAVSMTYDLHFSKTVKDKETTSIEQASAILSSMKKQNDEATASRGTQLKAKLKVLLNHVDSLDTETEETVEKAVDHLLSLVNSRSKKEGPHCASNEKVQVQRTSNKQNFSPKSLFGKQTLAEKSNVASALQPDSEVLSVHVGFDHTYSKN